MDRSSKHPLRSEEIDQQGEDTLREAGHPGTDAEFLRSTIEEDRRKREVLHERQRHQEGIHE